MRTPLVRRVAAVLLAVVSASSLCPGAGKKTSRDQWQQPAHSRPGFASPTIKGDHNTSLSGNLGRVAGRIQMDTVEVEGLSRGHQAGRHIEGRKVVHLATVVEDGSLTTILIHENDRYCLLAAGVAGGPVGVDSTLNQPGPSQLPPGCCRNGTNIGRGSPQPVAG